MKRKYNGCGFKKGATYNTKAAGEAAFNCLFRGYKKEALKRNHIKNL